MDIENSGKRQKAPTMDEPVKMDAKRMLQSSVKGKYCLEDVLVENSSSPLVINEQDIMEKYENFKRFDTVNDHSDHLIAKRNMKGSGCIPSAACIKEEFKILEKDLYGTEGIYVRVYESRVDLLRAVIIGPKGTPYHDGLFFFDVLIPSVFPNPNSPLVRYHSAGLQISPNMYTSGEVYLSLPKKASDGSLEMEEMWVDGFSSLLPLLVSIRDVYLNTNPLLVEASYKYPQGSINVQLQQMSVLYNENTIIKSLKTMVYIMNKPPKHFEEFVVGHFRSRVGCIMMACKSYMEGVFLEGKKEEMCSMLFRNEVASCIKPLVDAFIKIGANEAQQFLYLSEKKFPRPDKPTFLESWYAPRENITAAETDGGSMEDSRPAPEQEENEEQEQEPKTSRKRKGKGLAEQGPSSSLRRSNRLRRQLH